MSTDVHPAVDWTAENKTKGKVKMKESLKIELNLFSRKITSKHFIHVVVVSDAEGMLHLVIYLTHSKGLNAYLDDIASVPLEGAFEKELFLLVENDDCYSYIAGDGKSNFAISIFTGLGTCTEELIVPDIREAYRKGA